MSSKNDIDQKVYELSTLFEFSQLLNASLDIDFILDNLLLVIMGRMMINKSVVLLSEEIAKDKYSLKRHKGYHFVHFTEKEFEFDNPPTEIASSDDLPSNPFKEFALKHKLSHILPLISNQKVLGYILLGNKMNGAPFSKHDRKYLKSVLNIAGTTIENARSFDKIKSLNTELDKKVFKLNTLFDISKQFNAAFEETQIAKLLGFVLMSQLLVSRYFVFFKQNQNWNLLNSKGVDSGELKTLFIEKDLCFLQEVTNTTVNDRFGIFKEKLKIETLYPIVFQNEVKCVIGVGATLRANKNSSGDDEFLATLGNYTINALENAYLFKQELSRKRIEEEMQMARSIQRQLLPSKWAEPEGYHIFATNIPSFQVGGDLFDLISLKDGRMLTVIADVTGKGTPAALLMSNLQAAMRTTADVDIDLVQTMKKINNLICSNTSPDKFITGFAGLLDPINHKYSYVNAGHNPPYVYRQASGKLELLDCGGLLLGILEDVEYEEGEIDIENGDIIFLFTDGVSEATNEEENEFGEALLEKIICEYKDFKPKELTEKLLDRINAFRSKAPQSDDITIICIKKDLQ